MLITPNAAETIDLKNILNQTAPENLLLALYKVDITLTNATVLADFTEATFTGYGRKTLTGSSWVVTAGSPTTATYAAQVFTSTAAQTPQNIYGYYYIGATSGLLRGAERFSDGPYIVSANLQTITITPQKTLGSVTAD